MIPVEAGMTKADELRKYAENCADIARTANANTPKQKRFTRMAEAWKSLASNEDWLDGEPEEPGPTAA
jgi:hypothetical protein